MDYLDPIEISWERATCQLHASHLSVMYDSSSDDGYTSQRFQRVMISYDVDVFTAAPASTLSRFGDSFRVCVHAAACAARCVYNAATGTVRREQMP